MGKAKPSTSDDSTRPTKRPTSRAARRAPPAKRSAEEQTAAARRALDHVRTEWRRRPGVVEVTLGPEVRGGLATGRLAVVAFVADKMPDDQLAAEERLPDEVFGVPVDVVMLRPQLRSGLLIAPANRPGAYATVGMVVRRADDPFDHLLSVAHFARVNQPVVVSPAAGPGWGVESVSRMPGEDTRRVFSPSGDCALLPLASGTPVRHGVYGLPETGYRAVLPSKGMRVFRVDSSGQTVRGTVHRFPGAPLSFASGPELAGPVEIRGNGADGVFSGPGDSGAVVLQDTPGPPTLVGVLCGVYPREDGGEGAGHAAASEFALMANLLEIRLM